MALFRIALLQGGVWIWAAAVMFVSRYDVDQALAYQFAHIPLGEKTVICGPNETSLEHQLKEMNKDAYYTPTPREREHMKFIRWLYERGALQS